jgi:hypothetical protein
VGWLKTVDQYYYGCVRRFVMSAAVALLWLRVMQDWLAKLHMVIYGWFEDGHVSCVCAIRLIGWSLRSMFEASTSSPFFSNPRCSFSSHINTSSHLFSWTDWTTREWSLFHLFHSPFTQTIDHDHAFNFTLLTSKNPASTRLPHLRQCLSSTAGHIQTQSNFYLRRNGLLL